MENDKWKVNAMKHAFANNEIYSKYQLLFDLNISHETREGQICLTWKPYLFLKT